MTKDFGFLSASSDAFTRKLADLSRGWSNGLGAELAQLEMKGEMQAFFQQRISGTGSKSPKA